MANVVDVEVKGTDNFSPVADKAKNSVTDLVGKVGVGLAVFNQAAEGLGKITSMASGLIGKTADLGQAVDGLQDIIGGTAEDSSRLIFAFDRVGVSNESAEKAMKKFSAALAGESQDIDGVVTSSADYLAALDRLGIQTKDGAGNQLSMMEILKQTADVFSGIEDPIARATLAQKLFGKNGVDLLDFLDKGSAGIAALAKESDDLGLTLNDSTVEAVIKNKEEMRKFHAAVEGLQIQLGVKLLPVVSAVTEVIAAMGVAVNKHPAILAAVGAAIGAVLIPILIAGTAALVTMTAGWIAVGFAAAGAAAAMLIAAAPIIAIVAALALLAIGIILIVKHWDTIKEKTGEAIDALLNIIRERWPLILPVLLGPLGLLIMAVIENWDKIKATVQAGIEAVTGVLSGGWNMIAGIANGAWNALVGAAQAAWNAFKNAIVEPIQGIIEKIQSLIEKVQSIPSPGDVLGGIADRIPGANAILGRAGGGPAGGRTLVGEHGAEIVDLPGGSYVHSNADSGGLVGGSGGGPGLTVHVHVAGSIISERDVTQIIRDAIQRGAFRGIIPGLAT